VVAVDRHRHFTRAAEECGVSQPTLSMQIQKLEKDLGVEIFHRGTRRIRPTDVGREVVAQARAVLQEANRLQELAGKAGGEVAGELRLGVIPTVGPYVLPPCLPALGDHHPDLTLVVEELKTSELLEGLRNETLDAALLATPSDLSEFEYVTLFEEPFVAYLAPDHRLGERTRIHPEDLRMDELWLLQEGHCFRDQVLDLCSRLSPPSERPRPLRFESGSLDTLKRLVDEGGGMTLLPGLAVHRLSPRERARVRPFQPPSPSRKVCFAHGRTHLKRTAREVVIAELLRSIPRGAVALVSQAPLEAP
jgi:LysR family transcriptional regulator, hydrogen peroxide-inducible genes activator